MGCELVFEGVGGQCSFLVSLHRGLWERRRAWRHGAVGEAEGMAAPFVSSWGGF